jgi:hypothetical protein
VALKRASTFCGPDGDSSARRSDRLCPGSERERVRRRDMRGSGVFKVRRLGG